LRAGVLLLSPFIAWSTPLKAHIAGVLGQALEDRFARPTLPTDQRIDGIIVLGGSPTRVFAAVELAKRFPEAQVLLSGPGRKEIDVAREKAPAGVRINVDRTPTSTYENAQASKHLLAPRPGQCWVLVTSALHMPRAVGAFKAADFPVVPWPVQDTPHNLKVLSTSVWHEVFGLIGYWILGRSRDLYPGPTSPCAPRPPEI
jgi:uncharacterized SAM-binding protein YcdF (DUF218 family)